MIIICRACNDSGQVQWRETRTEEAHAPDCTGEQCSAACPIPMAVEVHMSGPCPHCEEELKEAAQNLLDELADAAQADAEDLKHGSKYVSDKRGIVVQWLRALREDTDEAS